MSITTAQIRAARGILNWNQTDLAERTGISATSIGSIENGQTTPRASTLATIRQAFENSGIEFIGTDGVRLRSGDVRVFSGQEGYYDFFELVYGTLERTPGEVLVSNVDERNFVKWHGDLGQEHVKRVSGLSGIKFKILLQEGDDYFPASSYAEYRWLPKDLFSSVPFYLFGKKLGIIIFDNEPKIIVLDYPAVADAYKKQFEAMWKAALLPTVEGRAVES